MNNNVIYVNFFTQITVNHTKTWLIGSQGLVCVV